MNVTILANKTAFPKFLVTSVVLVIMLLVKRMKILFCSSDYFIAKKKNSFS